MSGTTESGPPAITIYHNPRCSTSRKTLDRLRADGIEPVLVLDDVFAELDADRRARLAARAADCEQVLITAAVDDDVPASLRGRRLRVGRGTVDDA